MSRGTLGSLAKWITSKKASSRVSRFTGQITTNGTKKVASELPLKRHSAQLEKAEAEKSNPGSRDGETGGKQGSGPRAPEKQPQCFVVGHR
jgi:hypothetical protein